MRVLLINPPKYRKRSYIREGRCMQTKSSWAALWPPLSLAYTASLLEKEGFETRLLDCIAQDLDFKELENYLKEYSPRVAVINSAFPTIYTDLETASLAKSVDKEVKTLMVGMPSTLLEDKLLEECFALDAVVVGEPEWVVCNFCKDYGGGGAFSGVKGLIWRRGNDIVRNQPQDLRENDVNNLPFPARWLLDNSRYTLPVNGERFTLLSVGRGCPYACIFCTANIYYGKHFRKRDPSSVGDEIQECVEKHGIKNFLFWGETFTLDKEYAKDISREILNRRLRINWATTSRVDTLDKEMLSLMKEAGCQMLSLGIETVSDSTLTLVSKQSSFDNIQEAIELVGKSKIRRMGHFMFGLPFQTETEIKKTIDFSLKSGIEYAQFYCAVPYPKTGLEEIARKNNWISKDINWQDYDLTKSIMSNGFLSPDKIKYYRDLAYRKFYLRPRMFLQALRDVSSPWAFIKSLDFFKWIKAR